MSVGRKITYLAEDVLLKNFELVTHTFQYIKIRKKESFFQFLACKLRVTSYNMASPDSSP